MSRSSMSVSAAFPLTTLLARADAFEELHPPNTESCRIPPGTETLPSPGQCPHSGFEAPFCSCKALPKLHSRLSGL